MSIARKLYRLLNPQETLFDQLEALLSSKDEKIRALESEIVQSDIEIRDKAFYVEQFACVSRERDEYKNLLDVRTKDRDSREKSYQKAVQERDAARAELEARLGEFTRDRPSEPGPGAIYVDLDGTLAHHEKWVAPEIIGEPIPAMMDRVKAWVAEGKIVKIFTARFVEHHCFVRDWLASHGLGQLEVTSHKGIDGYEFWDDRAVQIEPNTGVHLLEVANQKVEQLRAELEDRRAEQAPLGDEVIALRKQVSELRSQLTDTAVHSGQIATLLSQAWRHIAELGRDPEPENGLMEHWKAERIRDMQTVKQYLEEAGEFRNTIALLRADVALLTSQLQAPPVGDHAHSEADAIAARAVAELQANGIAGLTTHMAVRRVVAIALEAKPTPPVTQRDIATALMDRTGVDYEPEDIDPDSEIGRDAAAVFNLLQRRGYPGPAPQGYPTWQQVKAKWDELTVRQVTNGFEDEGDFLDYLQANLPNTQDSNLNENEKESAA